MGAPVKLFLPVRTDEDGNPVTLAEHILETIRTGMTIAAACAACNVTTSAIHNWMQRGARARAMQAQHGIEPPVREQQFIAFVEGVEKAQAEAELTRLAIIKAAAEGHGQLKKVVTKRDADGLVVETTTTIEDVKPEWTAAAWFLERRYPDRYSRRVNVEHSGEDRLVGDHDRAREVAETLRAVLAAGAATDGEGGDGEVVDVDVVDDA